MLDRAMCVPSWTDARGSSRSATVTRVAVTCAASLWTRDSTNGKDWVAPILGRSHQGALRCLKRRRSDAVYRCLLADQHDQRSGAVRSGSHKGPLDGDLEPAGASPRPTVATRDLLPSRPGSVLSKIMGFEGQRIDVGEEDARPVAATDRQDRAIRLGGA
jgi:hypothetical protein